MEPAPSNNDEYEELPAELSEDVLVAPRASVSLLRELQEGDDMKDATEVADLDEDMYFSVLVAAFGGIDRQVGTKHHPKAHPFLLFVLCLPVYEVQISLIFALHVGMKGVFGKFYKDHLDEEVRFHEDRMLKLDVLLIGVLYVSIFPQLMSTLRLFFFVVNPLTWLEIHRPPKEKWEPKWPRTAPLFDTPMLMPWSLLALVMRFSVVYLVCLESVSLILSTKGVMNTIFNSLALSFVLDLSRQWFRFVQIFLKVNSPKDFAFRLKPEVWSGNDLKEEASDRSLRVRILRCVVKITSIPGRSSILRRNHGAHEMERFATSVVLFIIYSRQLFTVVDALDKNIVPAARDLCAVWRWHNGKDHSVPLWHWVFEGVNRMMVINLAEESNHYQDKTFKLAEHCMQPTYSLRDFGDSLALWRKHPVLVSLMYIGLVFLCGLVRGVYELAWLVIRAIKPPSASRRGAAP